MRDTHLFQLALGIDSPWFVSASNFDAEGKRLDIEINFKSGARLPCPDCKAADCLLHHTKLWRVVHYYVETALAELDLSALKLVSINETKSRPELKSSRCLWLKNDANLLARQMATRNSLARADLKTGCAWARRSRLEAMKQVAATLMCHRDGILA